MRRTRRWPTGLTIANIQAQQPGRRRNAIEEAIERDEAKRARKPKAKAVGQDELGISGWPVWFEVPGRCFTKKNHRKLAVIAGRARMLPAEAWEKWADTFEGPARQAIPWARWSQRVIERRPAIKRGIPTPRAPKLIPGFVPPVTVSRVHVTAVYHPPDLRWMPDLVGVLESVADALERCQILGNDSQIKSWDGSCIMPPDPAKVGKMEIVVRRMGEGE